MADRASRVAAYTSSRVQVLTTTDQQHLLVLRDQTSTLDSILQLQDTAHTQTYRHVYRQTRRDSSHYSSGMNVCGHPPLHVDI